MAGCPNGVFRPNSLICTTCTPPRSPALAQILTPRTRSAVRSARAAACPALLSPVLLLPSLGWPSTAARGAGGGHPWPRPRSGLSPRRHCPGRRRCPLGGRPVVIPSPGRAGGSRAGAGAPTAPPHPAERGSPQSPGPQGLA